MAKKKFTNKRERFLEVAETRTNNILEKIRILGNCSNRQLYEYTSEEINRIFNTINQELEKTKIRFKTSEIRRKRFKL